MAPKRKRLTATERKPQIMRSAIRALARSNYRTTSIAEIAAEAGITEPAVYRYFPTKKALFIAIIEDVGQRVLGIWNSLRTDAAGPLEALGRIGMDYYERAMTRRGDLKVLFQALAEVDDDEIREALRNEFSSYVDLLTDIIEEAQRTHGIREDVDAKAAAWCFLSVGFTLNLVGLLHLESDLSRRRFELVRELFIGSLLNDRNAAARVALGPNGGVLGGVVEDKEADRGGVE